MNNIKEVLADVSTIGIGGHVRPDGDCVGSCLGLYLYLKKNFPKIQVKLYLDEPGIQFSFLKGFDEIETVYEAGCEAPDLFITCDVSTKDRLAVAMEGFEQAKKTVCIDHHISNPGFAEVNHVCGDISSASEVMYTLMDHDLLDKDIATALYTGMVHDTGAFQYSSTSPETMRIAGELMKFGFDFTKIIEESFYQKTYVQNQVMGRVLAESIMMMDGKCIIGYLRQKDLEFYGVVPRDLDGIVSALRLTKGVEVAMFLYETAPQSYRVSLRSNGPVNVSEVACFFGGGGHVKAAGCSAEGSVYDVINNIMAQIDKQFQALNI